MKRLIALLCIAALPALAQENAAPAPSPEEMARLQAQAKEMREQAKQRRAAAAAAHDAAQQSCWDRFLVADCLETAKKSLREANRDAKRLEVEAAQIERGVRSAQREQRVRQRMADKQAEIEKRRAVNAEKQ